MDPGVIAVVILILLIVGAVAVMTRQRFDALSLPGLRVLGVAGAGPADDGLAHEAPLAAAVDAAVESGLLAARSTPARAPGETPLFAREREDILADVGPVRVDVAAIMPSPVMERLDQIEAQLRDVSAAVERQSAQIVRLGADVQRRADADEARREVVLERLRADLNAALSRLSIERQSSERRLEVSAELYARLARLESALSEVTNPVLLPGEPYEAPGDLLTEALIWENWNEVSERVFALADSFSAQRVHLSEQTREEFGEFVTALRLLLTRSIYPNLHTDLNDEQQAALRSALDELGMELRTLRAALDREYREANGS